MNNVVVVVEVGRHVLRVVHGGGDVFAVPGSHDDGVVVVAVTAARFGRRLDFEGVELFGRERHGRFDSICERGEKVCT